MSRNFCAAFVGSGDCSREFISSNEVINLEIVHPLVEPIVHSSCGIIRPGELMQLQSPTAFPFQIRPSNVYMWSGHCAGINRTFDFKVGIWLKRASRSDRSNSSRKIEPWEAVCHLAEDDIAHGIKHVIVHAHQAGDNAVAVEVENLATFGHTRGSRVCDGFDLAIGHEDGLIFAGRRAGSVNHANMLQHYDRGIYFHELFDFRGQILRNGKRATHEQAKQEKLSHDSSQPPARRILPDKLEGNLRGAIDFAQGKLKLWIALKHS